MTGEQIRQALLGFAQKWSVYGGSERSEAQTFLNELFACYGQDRSAVAQLEEHQEGGYVDLIWPRVCIVEMKRPSEADRLDVHRDQAFRYWRKAADAEKRIPAPRYVVLCAFTKFEIWEPGAFPEQPRATIDLIELPDQFETLLFLAGRDPVFMGSQVGVTREAVSIVAGIYQMLRDRRAAEADVLRDFVLQAVWCMFAEDLDLLDAQLFTQLLDRLIEDPQRSSVDDLGQLSPTRSSSGAEPTTGTPPWPPSRSTSATACPTAQSDIHTNPTEPVTVTITSSAYTETRTPSVDLLHNRYQRYVATSA